MKKRRARLFAMISFTILLCVCMVQFPTDFLSAADSSYTTMGGISVGDQLSDGAVLPWPSIEGFTVVNSYVYVYQDAWGANDILFRSFGQESEKSFTMPLYETLKGSFWLYMPKDETFGYWKVTGMTADVSEKVVTFFWHIKLIRQKIDNTPGDDNTGTGDNNTETPEKPGTPGDDNTGTGDNNTGTPEKPGTSGDNNTGTGDNNTGTPEKPGTPGDNNTGTGDNNTGTPEKPGTPETQPPAGSGSAQNPPKTPGSTKITAAGTYSLLAGTTYVLEGPVGVTGDKSYYASGISFQVSADGNYTFR